jgi:hypothetical protein
MSVEQMSELTQEQVSLIYKLISHLNTEVSNLAFDASLVLEDLSNLKNPDQDHEYRSMLWNKLMGMINTLEALTI